MDSINDKAISYTLGVAMVMCLICLVLLGVAIKQQTEENLYLKNRLLQLEKTVADTSSEQQKQTKMLEAEVQFFLTGGWK